MSFLDTMSNFTFNEKEAALKIEFMTVLDI